MIGMRVTLTAREWDPIPSSVGIRFWKTSFWDRKSVTDTKMFQCDCFEKEDELS